MVVLIKYQVVLELDVCIGTFIMTLSIPTNVDMTKYPLLTYHIQVSANGGLHKYADSQFGHVFAWGDTRESARRSLVLALKELSIRGDFRTTVEYLVKVRQVTVHCYHVP